jgi:hypothetical protein
MNLIKKHRPKYNVRLKDDKRYPYIKIHWAEPFPKVTVTRQMVDDGSRYFGPYTSAWAVYQTLDVLRRIFPYLTCDRVITGMDKRACLYYDIKLCTAPCIGAVNQAQYRQTIADLMDFLNGHSADIVSRLHQEMEKAAEEMRFEKAAAVRDQLKAIQSIIERQFMNEQAFLAHLLCDDLAPGRTRVLQRLLDRRQQLFAGRLFQQEPAGTGAHGPRGQLPVVVHRQHDDLAVDAFAFQPGQHLEAAQTRHRDVGDDDIGSKPLRRFHQLVSVTHRAHDIEIVLGEETYEAFLHDGVVIGDQHGVAAHRFYLTQQVVPAR